MNLTHDQYLSLNKTVFFLNKNSKASSKESESLRLKLAFDLYNSKKVLCLIQTM